jgi:inorganic phosphate transporter, PiT family
VNQSLSLPAFISLALILDVLTGILSAPSIVATMIASRAMSPRNALLLSTLAELIGPFLFGVAVANVIGSEMVEQTHLTPIVLYAGLCSTIFWMLFSYYLRIPSSSTHALIGGMIGAVIAGAGPSAVHSGGLFKVVASLTLSMPLGLLGGFLMVRFSYWLTRNASPKVNQRFNQGQLLASFGLGMAIGTSSAQNIMGIIVLGLVMTGYLPHFVVPVWVIAISAVALALGNLLGGMRMIKSIGARFFQIKPIHGFSAETASAGIIIISTILGGVVSTTHLTNLSIIGAGAGERLSIVRWRFVKSVVIAWVLTIPMTALLAALLFGLLNWISNV